MLIILFSDLYAPGFYKTHSSLLGSFLLILAIPILGPPLALAWSLVSIGRTELWALKKTEEEVPLWMRRATSIFAIVVGVGFLSIIAYAKDLLP